MNNNFVMVFRMKVRFVFGADIESNPIRYKVAMRLLKWSAKLLNAKTEVDAEVVK